MNKVILLILLSIALTVSAFAQSGELSGTVTDQRNNEPLPGVNILLHELNRGASTDMDGNYTVSNIPYGSYSVRVTFIGFRTINRVIEINAANTTINFELREDLLGLDEIIVTGQGSGVERKRLSTTVNSISARQIENLPAVQLDELLQANLPNSQIKLSSGQPGTASLIRGRGVNSALTSTTPVIYIDGVRVDGTSGQALGFATGGAQSSSIADIPVENIERIEFIKGGAATTQFGSDAANGVLQIFTKRGTQGAPQFSFETRLGATVGTEKYLRFSRTADIMYEPGLLQEYRLSASGGTRDLTYSFSGSMMQDEGFRLKNNQVRRNLRTTVSAKFSDAIRYTGSIGFTNHEFERDRNANSGFSAFSSLEGGNFGLVDDLDQAEFRDLKNEIRGFTDLVDITTEINRFQTSHQLDVDIIENLTATAVVGLDFRNSRERFITTNEFLVAIGSRAPGTTDQGFLGQGNRDFLGVTLEASARYQIEFGDFSSITSVGGQLFRDDDRQLRVDGSGLPDGSRTVGSSAEITGFDFRRTVANYGVYILENIGYKDRLFLEGGIRLDQNSAFGDEVDTQIFPKVGLVYNLSSEPFFQELISTNIISTVRLRANYGEAGNFPTPFSNLVLASVNPFLGSPSLEFGLPGDTNLKPEKTRTFEIGADVSFFNDRYNLEFTYFDAKTTDALFNAPFAPSFGLGTALQNLGTIENSGIELAGSFNFIRTRDANVTLRASINTLTNVVADNGGSAPFAVGGFQFLGSFVDEGKPVGFLRGNRSVFDEDGNVIEVINNDELGSPVPDVFGSVSLNADYKRFTFTATGDYQLGAQGVAVDDVLRFFSGISDEGRIPENAAPPGGFFDLASVWVEDTDFFKVRLISAAYNIPERLYAGAVRNIRVGFSVTNPFNFSSSSFDPEATGAGIAGGAQGGLGVGGFGFGTESNPRQFVGSLRVSF
jgi:outer membrane receptor protein involved in Fe transport